MKRLLLFCIVIFTLNSTKAQIGKISVLPNKNQALKETIKQRLERDGFHTDGAPTQEHLWMIELGTGEKKLDNAEVLKEIERRKKTQTKKFSYNLKSKKERYEYYIHNPIGKKIPKPLAQLQTQKDDEITFIVLIFYLTFAPGKMSSWGPKKTGFPSTPSTAINIP